MRPFVPPRKAWVKSNLEAHTVVSHAIQEGTTAMAFLAQGAMAVASVALAWSVVIARVERPRRRYVGVAGAWLGALVLTAIWRVDVLPPVLVVPQLFMLGWLAACAMLAVDAGRSLHKRPVHWKAFTALSLSSLAILAAVGLHFLWLATVSPDGV